MEELRRIRRGCFVALGSIALVLFGGDTFGMWYQITIDEDPDDYDAPESHDNLRFHFDEIEFETEYEDSDGEKEHGRWSVSYDSSDCQDCNEMEDVMGTTSLLVYITTGLILGILWVLHQQQNNENPPSLETARKLALGVAVMGVLTMGYFWNSWPDALDDSELGEIYDVVDEDPSFYGGGTNTITDDYYDDYYGKVDYELKTKHKWGPYIAWYLMFVVVGAGYYTSMQLKQLVSSPHSPEPPQPPVTSSYGQVRLPPQDAMVGCPTCQALAQVAVTGQSQRVWCSNCYIWFEVTV